MSLALCDCVCRAMPSRAVYGEKSMCERACANPIYYFTLCFFVVVAFVLFVNGSDYFIAHVHAFDRASDGRADSCVDRCMQQADWFDTMQKTENWKLTLNYGDTIQTFIAQANAFAICIDFYWLNRSMCVSHFEQLPIELIWCVWKGAAVAAIDIHRSQFTISFRRLLSSRTYLRFDLVVATAQLRQWCIRWHMSMPAAANNLRLLKSVCIDDDTFLRRNEKKMSKIWAMKITLLSMMILCRNCGNESEPDFNEYSVVHIELPARCEWPR